MTTDRTIDAEDIERGKRFKALREHLDLTQEAVAEAAGVPRVRVNKLEKGGDKFTAHDFQIALAKATGVGHGKLVEYMTGSVSMTELLTGTGTTTTIVSRYPWVEETIRHLRARNEDPAAIEQLEQMTAARHGDYVEADMPEMWKEAQGRAKKLDAVFGTQVETMRRPPPSPPRKKR